MTIRDNSKINTRENHKIRINNVWPFNHAFMTVGRKAPKPKMGLISQKEAELSIERMRQGSEGDSYINFVHKSGARSQNERAGGARSQNETCSQRARSQYELNNNPLKEPNDLNNQPAVSKRQSRLLQKNELKKTASDVFHWLKNFGVNPKTAKNLLNLKDIDVVHREIKKFMNSWKYIIFKSSPVGYLVSLIRDAEPYIR